MGARKEENVIFTVSVNILNHYQNIKTVQIINKRIKIKVKETSSILKKENEKLNLINIIVFLKIKVETISYVH